MSSPDGIRFDLAAAACLPQVLEQLLDASVREEETFAHAAQLALLDPVLYAQLLDAACAQGLTANRRFAVVSKLLAGMGWNTIRAVASSAALAISFGAVSRQRAPLYLAVTSRGYPKRGDEGVLAEASLPRCENAKSMTSVCCIDGCGIRATIGRLDRDDAHSTG